VAKMPRAAFYAIFYSTFIQNLAHVVFWALAGRIVGKPTIVSQAENSFSETPASPCAGNFSI
jgi:hypothetical protein